MREVTVTVVGNVGSDPAIRETPHGQVANFNVGSSNRFYDRTSGQWTDGPTSWYRVACWNRLGRNAAESFRKGERVIVVGRLKVGTYQDKDGVERASVEITADHVGHELTFGTTRFARFVRERDEAAGADDGVPPGDDEEPEAEVDLVTGEMLDGDAVPA